MPESPPVTSPADKPGLGPKLAFGSGAFAEKIIFDADKQLANPIFNVTLGIAPGLVGLILSIPRLWDAVTDPVMGVVSDKIRTRWGRRRPFILLGAILTAITFFGLWHFPLDQTPGFYFGYLLALSLCFYTAVTIWSVPYQALGYELSTDYDERTRVQGFRAFFNASGNMLTPWLFFFTQLPIWGGTIPGLRAVSTIAAVVILVLAMLPALLIKERPVAKQVVVNRLSVWKNLGSVMKFGPFRLLIGVVLLIQIGGYMVAGLGFYVATYHIYGGDLQAASKFLGYYGTVYYVMAILAAPMAVALATRLGKVRAFAVCCGLGILGSMLKWFCYTPDMPYLAFVVPLFLAPGYAGIANVLFHSMVADICDIDELDSGLRREGTFVAVGQWMLKMGQSLSFLIAGLVLTLVGFEATRGGNQADGVITGLRLCFALVPSVAFALGLVLIRRFRITAEEMRGVRRDINARTERDRASS